MLITELDSIKIYRNNYAVKFVNFSKCARGARKSLISLLIKKRDLSVCLSGYTFRHALMSHVDILDIDRGHIFRKHRHKNNKKVAFIYEKTVKNLLLLRFSQAGCYGASTFIVRF